MMLVILTLAFTGLVVGDDGPALRCTGLSVQLDTLLPRPTSVLHTHGDSTNDFTPHVSAPTPSPPGPPSPPTDWWKDVPNQALTLAGGGTTCDGRSGCVAYEVTVGNNNPAGVAACASACDANGELKSQNPRVVIDAMATDASHRRSDSGRSGTLHVAHPSPPSH